MKSSLFAHLLDPVAAPHSSPAVFDGERVVSRAELSRAAESLAARLAGLGLAPGDTLAFLLPNSLEMVVAVLAGVRLQARLLFMDPAYKGAEISRCCEEAEARLILSNGRTFAGPDADRLPPVITVPPAEELLAAGDGAGLRPSAGTVDHTVFLFLSSGTTGLPKLVPYTADQMAAVIGCFRSGWQYGAADRMAAVLPLFHLWGLGQCLLTPLASGTCMHLIPTAPRQLVAAVASQGITMLPAPPFLFRLLIETEFSTPPDFSALRLAISGGSALTPAMAERFRGKFGIGLVQSYGTTECGTAAQAFRPAGERGPGWLWHPYPGVQVTTLDGSGREVPPEVIGSIAVRGPACAGGYLHSPEATAAVFRNGYVLTGDTGFRGTDGQFCLLGRDRPMLDIAGKKVAPAEVEACLRQHPAVIEAQVSGGCNAEGHGHVRALVAASAAVTARELRDHCLLRLADYKVPREIEFTSVAASGPLDKPRLNTRDDNARSES